jgi:hypothetical protein
MREPYATDASLLSSVVFDPSITSSASAPAIGDDAAMQGSIGVAAHVAASLPLVLAGEMVGGDGVSSFASFIVRHDGRAAANQRQHSPDHRMSGFMDGGVMWVVQWFRFARRCVSRLIFREVCP